MHLFGVIKEVFGANKALTALIRSCFIQSNHCVRYNSIKCVTFLVFDFLV